MKLFVFCLLILCQPAWAQLNPRVDYYDAGESYREIFNDVFPLDNGGLVAVGETYFKSWIVKVADNGNVIWQDVGQQRSDYATVIEADNGDILVGGNVGGSGGNISVTRLDSEGEEIWSRTYGSYRCNAIIELKDGRCAIVGRTWSKGSYIALIESSGEVIWQHEIDPNSRDAGFFALRETNNGLIAVGKIQVNQGVQCHGKVVKVDFEGNLVWSHEYTLDENAWTNARLTSIISTGEGDYAISGWGLFGERNNNYWGSYFLRIDSDGDIIAEAGHHLRPNGTLYAESIARLNDGTFLMVGHLSQHPPGPVPFIDHLTADGALITRVDSLEMEELPPDMYAHFMSIIARPDGNTIICGSLLNPNDSLGQDAVIIYFRPEPVGVNLFYRSPEDSLLTALLYTSLDFMVRARIEGEAELHYQWAQGDSLLGTDTTQLIEFDEIGNFPVTCTVTGGEYSATASWVVTVLDFFIASHSPDTLSLALRRGVTQTFSLDSVAALDGDPINYQWTLTNLDNFEREDAGAASSATVQFLRCGSYQMEGAAYRDESSDNVVWRIQVRSAILDFWPGALSLSVQADSLVNFGVLPFNPESDSLSYRWEVDGDSVGADSTVGLRFVWDGFGNPPYAVAAIVMDGAEGDTVRWEVTVLDPNATPPTPPSIEGGEVPTAFGITSVSPNPFNNSTTIRFSTGSINREVARLGVYSLDGRLVAELANGPFVAGEHSFTVAGLQSGVYLVALETQKKRVVRKIVCVK